jgi:hypothetical protein
MAMNETGVLGPMGLALVNCSTSEKPSTALPNYNDAPQAPQHHIGAQTW